MLDDYTFRDKIGEGSFGTVFRATRKDGCTVAIKKIKRLRGEDVNQSTLREMVALTQLRHQEYIVELLEVIFTNNGVFLVFPYYEYSLFQFIKTRHIDYQKIFKQLLGGLHNIHKCGFMHRDLKPLNILVDSVGNIRIADFGMARQHYHTCQLLDTEFERYTYEVMTLHYRPPENLLGSENYDTSADIWSLGCIFSQIVTGQVLFLGDSQIEMLFKIFQLLGSPSALIAPSLAKLKFFSVGMFPRFFPTRFLSTPEYIDKIGYAGCNLLQQMLQLDPSSRITAQDAMLHVFFT